MPPLALAMRAAEELVELLRPACEEIRVAGSIRRQKEEVKDVELVALPLFEPAPSLFGDMAGEKLSALEGRIATLLEEGRVFFDPKLRRNGEKYKRLVYYWQHGGVKTAFKVDLFIADSQNFGNTLAIRTGDSDFSKALVTLRKYGGLMPSYLKQTGGYLMRGSSIMACRTEESYFSALGVLDVPEPEHRTAALAARLAKALAPEAVAQ